MSDQDQFKSAVNGWRQAISIVEAQQKALDWCMARLKKIDHEQSEHLAREYYEIVMRAQKTGEMYVKSMRTSGALAGGSKQEAR